MIPLQTLHLRGSFSPVSGRDAATNVDPCWGHPLGHLLSPLLSAWASSQYGGLEGVDFLHGHTGPGKGVSQPTGESHIAFDDSLRRHNLSLLFRSGSYKRIPSLPGLKKREIRAHCLMAEEQGSRKA